MGMLLWLLLLFMGFIAALASSAKLRKGFIIWFSYATITGWYYFRVLQKKYTSRSNKEEDEAAGMSSPLGAGARKKTKTTSLLQSVEGKRDTDLVYFEPRDVIEKRQQARQDALEHNGILGCSSRMSDGGSSSNSDGSSTPSKHKRRLFHSRRKAAAEEAVRRVSDASSIDLLTLSGMTGGSGPVTPTRNSATRRMYTGRKKPLSWAE